MLFRHSHTNVQTQPDNESQYRRKEARIYFKKQKGCFSIFSVSEVSPTLSFIVRCKCFGIPWRLTRFMISYLSATKLVFQKGDLKAQNTGNPKFILKSVFFTFPRIYTFFFVLIVYASSCQISATNSFRFNHNWISYLCARSVYAFFSRSDD